MPSQLETPFRAIAPRPWGTVCLTAALVIDWISGGGQTGVFSLPAMIVTALFVGVMGGLMFASIIIGGREDDRATRAALDQQPRFDRVNH